MSFGAPNNPYGQQPPAPQGQPQYGYPQQAPQGVPPQAGYGYPQAPQGIPAYPAGAGLGYPAPGMQMGMPGSVVASRVILFIFGGFAALIGVIVILIGVFTTAATSSSSSEVSDLGALAGGAAVAGGLVAIALSLWPILTAAKLSKGRTGVRVSGIIYGSLISLFNVVSVLINLFALGATDGTGAGGLVFSLLINVVVLGLGIWIIAGLANSAAGAYFRRP
ncbi:hypothetical protein [Streptomyces venezuelae]|uniref:hypothetical protein n=1 Tax=Streptomyces venezuelae TaxID=54571 RepID=UPI0016817B0C|nr:hypothetical protein [Streptomyces venezuelae]